MIKKHLIACSVLLLLILVGKNLIKSSPANRLESFPKKGDFPRKEPKKDNLDNALSFANEKVPVHSKRVARRMNWYLKEHSFENLQTRSLHYQASKWFPIIEPILKAYKIPEDFKYIPLVESGLKHGTSHKGASGYWQFMPQTARVYGLKVNAHVDERMNVRKSTVAAAKYLRSLYKEFGNWTLVAAAYNLGENKLHNEINRQKLWNYYKIKLNSETGSYVYKLVSMKQIIEQPAKYGYLPLGKRKLLAKAEPQPTKSFINPRIEHSAILAPQLLQN